MRLLDPRHVFSPPSPSFFFPGGYYFPPPLVPRLKQACGRRHASARRECDGGRVGEERRIAPVLPRWSLPFFFFFSLLFYSDPSFLSLWDQHDRHDSHV